jgi:hypothetical protein
MGFDRNPSRVDVYRRAGRTSGFILDNFSEAPIAMRSGDLADNSIRVLTNWSEAAAGEISSPSTDTSQLVLPVARLQVPALRRSGLIHWEIEGDYSNPTPNNTTLAATLIVDATPTGTEMTWTQNAAVTATGVYRLSIDLVTSGNYTSPRHIAYLELTILNSSGVAVLGGATTNTKLSQIYSLNSLVDQSLLWEVRKSVAGANAVLTITSVFAYQLCRSSGV